MAEDENEGGEVEDEADLTFEDALSRLEEVVHRMESGDIPLESLVENYQSGVSLLKLCRAKIEAAEMKVKEVSGGEAVELQPEE
ncbi:MAG TPA: exodeoxyribonuclease VII small subunit [Opitutae bacterium]|nr:exodeoxyribonuclease VII small subunit [Opitutae bacterium]|tara:strand:+ start:2306 stop:2557 length:252 start_codon:yes stop_codon:yes gene_type:complete